MLICIKVTVLCTVIFNADIDFSQLMSNITAVSVSVWWCLMQWQMRHDCLLSGNDGRRYCLTHTILQLVTVWYCCNLFYCHRFVLLKCFKLTAVWQYRYVIIILIIIIMWELLMSPTCVAMQRSMPEVIDYCEYIADSFFFLYYK